MATQEPDAVTPTPAQVAVERRNSSNDKETIEPAHVERLDTGDELDDEPELSKPATTFDVLTHTIHLQDDPSLPAITFRSMLIGRSIISFIKSSYCR